MNFTDGQIKMIREASFLEVSLDRNIILKSTAGLKLKTKFLVKENQNNPKIFAKKNSRKLKIKTFVITDNNLSLDDISNVVELEEFINKNKIITKDFIADSDFIGSRSNLDMLKTSEGIYHLFYENDFMLENFFDKSNIRLFAIMYYDLREILINSNTSFEDINLDILSSDIYELDISLQNDSVSESIDLDALNSLFIKSENLLENSQNIAKQKKITYKPKNKPVYFSELLYSIDEFANLNMIFTMDLQKIVKDSTTLTGIVKNIDPITFQELSDVVSLKVIRREYEKIRKNPPRYKLKNSPIYSVISTTQDKNTDPIVALEDENAKIYEEPGVFSARFKTIQIVDKKAYKTNPNIYQYGIEIVILNKLYSHIKTLKDTLIEDRKIILSYLSDSENVLYYDTSLSKFKNSYLDIYNTKQGDIKKLISHFIMCLRTVSGALTKPQFNTINNVFNPLVTSNEILSYFLKIYDRVINIFNNQLDDKSDNLIKHYYWFNKKIDTSDRTSSGYGYIYKQNRNGFMTVNTSNLNTKLSSDINSYLSNPVKTYTYTLSPTFVKIKGETTQFNSNTYIDLKQNITDSKYIDLELDIKSHILSEHPSDIPDISKTDTTKKTISNFVRAGPSIENIFSRTSDIDNIFSYGVDKTEKINNKINPDIFLLSILKNDIKETKSITNIKQIPFQIQSLIDKTDNYFGKTAKNYKTDLNVNSKFFMLFNTICFIEYLDNSTTNLKYKWNILDDKVISKMKAGSKFLCKFKIYSDYRYDINHFAQVKLPIYDEYFILQKDKTTSLDIKIPPIKRTRTSKRQVIKTPSTIKTLEEISKSININTKKIKTAKVVPFAPKKVRGEMNEY